jgi:hypothetical protein
MYAHHNTDRPEVLPCNRNNCRCGNDKNCMYYNNPDNAHYNYTAVQGTGDAKSPFYKCPSMAMDTYNQEGVYGDHAINGLGGYNDGHAYGEVDNPKGIYGDMGPSYPAKPTCGGYTNDGAQTCDDNHDHDKWDRYHKFHKFHKVWNGPEAAAAEEAGLSLGLDYEGGLDMPDVMFGYGQSQTNLTPYVLLALLGGGLYYAGKKGMVNRTQTIVAAVVALILFFFFRQ